MLTQHETREILRAKRSLEEVEKQPLFERQRARDTYALYLKNQPDRIASEVDHILRGDYGEGFYIMAWRALDESPRMNHPALFGQWVAARCCSCPAAFARQAWNKLSKAEQEAITQSILDVISDRKEAQ